MTQIVKAKINIFWIYDQIQFLVSLLEMCWVRLQYFCDQPTPFVHIPGDSMATLEVQIFFFQQRHGGGGALKKVGDINDHTFLGICPPWLKKQSEKKVKMGITRWKTTMVRFLSLIRRASLKLSSLVPEVIIVCP